MADSPNDAKLLNAIRRSTAASLAGGIIAASGRPHSTKEAMAVLKDVHSVMFPKQAGKAPTTKA